MKIIRLKDIPNTHLNLHQIIKTSEGWALDEYNEPAHVLHVSIPGETISLPSDSPEAQAILNYLARHDHELLDITKLAPSAPEQTITDTPTPNSIIDKLMSIVSGTFTDHLGRDVPAPIIVEANHDSLGNPHLWCISWWPNRPNYSPPIRSELEDIALNQEAEKLRRNTLQAVRNHLNLFHTNLIAPNVDISTLPKLKAHLKAKNWEGDFLQSLLPGVAHHYETIEQILTDLKTRRMHPIFSVGNHDKTQYSVWPGYTDLTSMTQIPEKETREFVQKRIREIAATL